MQAVNEPIYYENPLIPMKIYYKERPEGWFKWHFHRQVELLYIIDGRIDLYVDQQKFPLQKEDVIIIGPHQLHRDYSHEIKYFVFHFDFLPYFDPASISYMKLFSGMTIALSELNYIFHENEDVKKEIANCMMSIYKEATEKAYGFEMAISWHIRKIFLTLLRADTRKVLTLKNSRDMERLKPVLEYVEKNVTRKISAREASRIVNMSYAYFVTYFKKAMGQSFIDYVNHRKIKLAERILVTEDTKIEQIGERIGLENTGHFFKTFRKFNQCSPNEFRRKMLEMR